MANNVICQLADPDGGQVGTQLDLPQDAGPRELETLLNSIMQNEEKLPYAFFIDDQELTGPLGAHLLKHNVSVERVLSIVCQPQAVFRIRPVTRCSASIPGHSEAVLSVAFSPDGRQLASGSGDTTVRMWDIHTQTPFLTCIGHTNWVLCIAWSPDGRQLASGSMDNDVRIWDPSSKQPSGFALKGHKKWITSIAWEPAHLAAPCRRLASASKDGDIRIWDIVLRKTVLCLTGHTLAVTCVKWGGDGLLYTGWAAALIYCTIKVWETSTGKLVRELKGHGHWVNSLALSTEHVLRTGPFDHTGAPHASPEAIMQVYAVDWSPDGEKVASGGKDRVMKLWMS
eukprot:jgi/Mesen1/7928/ME000422S07086